MQTLPTQLDSVIYNAADQSFEALVTVHERGRAKRYACQINAPITMSYADAASGLAKQALRRHRAGTGMRSEWTRHMPALRAGRAKFDLRGWLAQFTSRPGQRAA